MVRSWIGKADWYDYGARMYDATLGRFMKTDRFLEKYVSLSPYQYGANNPVNNVDINGDSIAVLNLGYGSNQHLAILIQNDEGEWQYFSVNGDNVFSSGKHKGGRMFDDLGEHSFNSPEEFMNSEYNKEGNKEDENVSNYHFSSAYILPTDKKQDGMIRDEFIRISKKEEYSLNVFSPNHCATTVQRSLQKAGIDTKSDIFVPVNSGIGQMIHLKVNPYLPSDVYRAIKQNNPKGYELKIK
jgi:RHS repeat-associated protein